MYTKFDFEKFERSRVITTQTLDGLDALDVGTIDFTKYCNKLNDDEKILIEERAAIIEFDGGLTRNEAESLALEEIKSHVL
jgi:hypothetical protein